MCRSPLLTCAFGTFAVLRYIATTYEYVFIWRGDDIGKHGVVDLIGFPALLTAEIALVMTAVRLLVMYHPRTRAKWGRYTKEKPLACGLGLAWVLMETAVWAAAWSVGIARFAGFQSGWYTASTLPYGLVLYDVVMQLRFDKFRREPG